MRVLLAALAVAAATATVFSQAGSPADPSKLDRVDLLAAWSDAVDRHQPGVVDESLRLVSTWSARELTLVARAPAHCRQPHPGPGHRHFLPPDQQGLRALGR